MTTHQTRIASLLALALSITPTLRAEEAAPEPKTEAKAAVAKVIEALNSSGLDKETVAEIRKSIESGETGTKTQVIRKTIIVGPDGKVQESDGDTAPLKKLLSEIGKSGDSPTVKVAGKAVIIGPDGQKKEIDLAGPEGIDSAVKEALKGANLDPNTLEFLSVGPGVLVNPKEGDRADLEKKVEQLQSDVSEIRAMLKKIEEKLR